MVARMTVTMYPMEMVDQLEQSALQAGQQMSPMIRSMPGFKGGYWMADRSTGRFIGLTFWETEENAQGYEAATAQLRAQTSAGQPQQAIEHFEVYDTLMP